MNLVRRIILKKLQMLLKIQNSIVLIVLILTAYCGLYSQVNFGNSESRNFMIAGIEVQGAKFAEEQTIKTLSGLRVGDQMTIPGDNKINTAIRNLWKRKQFSNVEIIVDKITAAGVFLIIRVEENPRLKEILIEDNQELSDEDIKKELGKNRGDIVSQYDVYLASKRIKELYGEEGLDFARVESRLIPTDTSNYSSLLMTVSEGLEFYVSKIEFEGNEFFSDSELEGAFDETGTKSWYEFWKSSKFNKKDFEKDLDLLKDFYKSHGFVDAEVVKDTILYDEIAGEVTLNIEVNEGLRTFIRNIKFSGNTVYPDELLLARLDFELGEPYDAIRFQQNLTGNEDQTDVSSVYMNNGFLMVRMEKELKRVSEDSVDVTVVVFEGERVRIRRIDIVGNTKTKDKVIRREIYTKPGDYFDRSAIIRSIQGLGVLQYFNPETLRPDVKPVATDATAVDLVYNVEERSTDTFNASIGFAGSFGLTGAIGMTFNNFSIAEPLKGGAGQIFNFTWEFGQASRYRTFSLGFTEPWFMDEPTTIGANVFDTRYNFSGIDQTRTGVSLNLGRRFKWPDDYFRGDWNLRLQSNDVRNSGGFYREGQYSEYTIQQTISRISLDNMFFPTTGSRFSLSSSFAMGAIGIGNTDYLKNELNFEILNPLLRIQDYNRLVLYLGSKIGFLHGFQSDTLISPIELYYMGGNGLSGFGVTPLRGYDDRTIGPRDGGRVLARYQAELRFAVSVDPMPIYVYLFAEAGNVWKNLRETDPFDLKRAFGLGIKMMINPIGVIGFSYGYGVDIDNSGKTSGWKFLFHLGQ